MQIFILLWYTRITGAIQHVGLVPKDNGLGTTRLGPVRVIILVIDECETFGGEPELLAAVWHAAGSLLANCSYIYLGWIMTQLSPARYAYDYHRHYHSVTLVSFCMGMHIGMSSVTTALAIAIIMYIRSRLYRPGRMVIYIAQQHTMHLIVPYSRHSTIVSFVLPW